MTNSYLENKSLFLNAARFASAHVTSYELRSHRGPDGEVLATDVATMGSINASNVVVISSGIHGVELPIGSKLQSTWLPAAKEICSNSQDIRFVFVHALNPFGAAYGLRNDQNNVDLNRNFISNYQYLPPTSENYRALKDSFAPLHLGAFEMAKAWGKMLKFAFVDHSVSEFKQALVGGQYEFKDGLYYGGSEPAWTQKTWISIVEKHIAAADVKSIWHMDTHTGYGPRGKLQVLVNTNENSPLHERVKQFALPEEIRITGTFFADVTGDIVDFWSRLGIAKDAVITPVAIEIGTSKAPAAIEGLDVLHAMIERNALKQRYNDQYSGAERIIRNMQNTFNPVEADWQNGAVRQGQQLWQRLVSSLHS